MRFAAFAIALLPLLSTVWSVSFDVVTGNDVVEAAAKDDSGQSFISENINVTAPKGEQIVDGDIVMNTAEIIKAFGSDGNVKRGAINLVSSGLRIWNPAVVPYEIAKSLYDEAGRIGFDVAASIARALQEIQSKSCIKFRKKVNSDSDYISFFYKKNSGCWSYVGKRAGKQNISLGHENCFKYQQPLIHEVMHALGFLHEQSRPDRNKHIKVLYENVRTDKVSQFKMYSEKYINSLNEPYDYKSVMHYRNKDFSNNTKNTLEKIGDPKYVLGARPTDGLTILDAAQLNKLYKCPTKAATTAATTTTKAPTTRAATTTAATTAAATAATTAATTAAATAATTAATTAARTTTKTPATTKGPGCKVRTVGGPDSGACCVFPFQYSYMQRHWGRRWRRGRRKTPRVSWYYGCTGRHIRKRRLWCATTSKLKQHNKKWGYCPVSTVGGNAGGKHCVFPFTYRKKTYSSCTHVDHYRWWCATTSDFDKDGKWGICDLSSEQVLANGDWGAWSAYGGCSVTCGGGQRRRSRSCDNPPPANGGLECLLSGKSGGRGETEYQTEACNPKTCPVTRRRRRYWGSRRRRGRWWGKKDTPRNSNDDNEDKTKGEVRDMIKSLLTKVIAQVRNEGTFHDSTDVIVDDLDDEKGSKPAAYNNDQKSKEIESADEERKYGKKSILEELEDAVNQVRKDDDKNTSEEDDSNDNIDDNDNDDRNDNGGNDGNVDNHLDGDEKDDENRVSV